jgi:diguanylate cyclase (GGDEF)-like protein
MEFLSMPLKEREFSNYLEKQTLKDLDERTLNGTYIYLAAWLLIGAGTGFHKENELYYWSFAGLFLVAGAIRVGIYKYYSKMTCYSFSTRIKWHYCNMLVPSFLFSILFSLAFYSPKFEGLFIYLLMAIFALLSAGTVNFAPIKKMSFAFVMALTALPFSTAMLSTNSHFVEGLMLLLYTTYMLLQANRLNKEYLLRLEQQFELNRLSQQDSLTGLANRRCFDESLNKFWKMALRSNSCIGLIIIDIDFFKRVNDTYGHSVGDEVIKKVASATLSVCKRDTDIVARLGGEEYAVILNNCDSKITHSLAEKIRETIQETEFQSDKKTISVTASIGSTFTVPSMAQSTATFYTTADQSMYTAKESGRNMVITNEYRQ